MDMDDDPFQDSSVKPSRLPARAGRRFQPKAKAKSQSVNPSLSVKPNENGIPQSTTTQADSAEIIVEHTTSSNVRETNEEFCIPASIESDKTDPTLVNSSKQVTMDHKKSGFENAQVFSTSDYLDDMLINANREVRVATNYNYNHDVDADMDVEHTESCVGQTQTSIDSAFNVTEPIREFETQDIEPEEAFASGRRAKKYQPKSKIKGRKEKSIVTSCPDSSSCELNHSNTENMEEDLTHELIPNLTSTELPVNEDVINLSEPTQENLTRNEGEHDNDDDDDIVIKSLKKKKSQKKSKKHVTDIEKPVAKRKKTSKTKEQPNEEEPKKKFSHSSRRNKRSVDKALLLLPDDEIDYRNMPFKDLILLAEHKERIAKKEDKLKESLTVNESNENTLHEEDNNSFRMNDFDSEDDEEQNNDVFTAHQASYKTESNSSYFNYGSYMKKEARSRWSKQDTELFYEAVGQFGTDFSMIQQLFPGKTRHQIKLKYKREQRQNPLRLYDAETNRSKDHCHFEKVIEQLQQAGDVVQAELDEANEEEESIYSAGDDVDEVATKEEVEKLEVSENEADAKDHPGDDNNLPKSTEDDDDDDNGDDDDPYENPY
ncbi:hypothetical protein ACFE04_018336 [Oxalis oulophora]